MSNLRRFISRGLWMYLWTIQVLLLDEVASRTIFWISSNSLATYMPWPLLVFSPGFIIQIFLGKLCVWYTSSFLSNSPPPSFYSKFSFFSGLPRGELASSSSDTTLAVVSNCLFFLRRALLFLTSSSVLK
jgi:hypothetical protein